MFSYKATVLGILLMLFIASAEAALVDFKKGDKTSLSANEIYEKGEFKGIRVENKSLKDVMQAVQNISGLNVAVDDGLLSVPVDANVEKKDWVDVLKSLLRDFNIVFNFIDSDITGVKVLSIHGEPDDSGKGDAKEGTSSDQPASNRKAVTEKSISPTEVSSGSGEMDELGRPKLLEGEYIGDTKIKIRRSYPDGFRVSVMPETHPPGFTDNAPPPGAEGTMFRPSVPSPGIKPSSDVDNAPPPGSTP